MSKFNEKKALLVVNFEFGQFISPSTRRVKVSLRMGNLFFSSGDYGFGSLHVVYPTFIDILKTQQPITWANSNVGFYRKVTGLFHKNLWNCKLRIYGYGQILTINLLIFSKIP